jgi:hypothetical protein
MTFVLIRYCRIAVFAIAANIIGTSAGAQASLKCRPADNYSASMISNIQWYDTTTNTQAIYRRDSVMRLPVVNSTQVSLVTDERICAKVVDAYTALPNGYTPANLYVIKIGTKGYVSHDPGRKVGEFTVFFVFNTKYVRTGGWGG